MSYVELVPLKSASRLRRAAFSRINIHITRRVCITLASALAWLVWSLFAAYPVHAAPGTDTLGPDEELRADQSITSNDGRFTLIMQSDGNVVLYQNGVRPLWESATMGSGATRLVMQSDGNLVAYRSDNVPVWATGTVSSPSRLFLQDDGNLVLIRIGAGVVWATGTYPLKTQNARVASLGPNEILYAGPDQALMAAGYTLILQGDGNLVVLDNSGRAIWATNTAGSGADRLIMQSDGNLVLYRRNTTAVWATNTRKPAGGVARLTLQNDGSLLVTHGGAFAWQSKVSAPPPTPQQRPNLTLDISTSELSGSGFLRKTRVYVYATRDDWLKMETHTESDVNGKIELNVDDILSQLQVGCFPGHKITFMANDDRWDKEAKNYLWSTAAEFPCH